MNEVDDLWERRLREIAADLAYPPTPEIASAVARKLETSGKRGPRPDKRLAWAFAILIIFLAGLLAVPPVRAQILDFLQIGVVRIFLTPPTPTGTLAPTRETSQTPIAATPTLPPPAPPPTPTLLPSLLDLAGKTTLEAAKKQVKFQVLLPTSPEGIGPPDDVFLQNLGGNLLVLVWLQPDHPDQIRFSLHEYGPEAVFVEKLQPQVVKETQVNGASAFWTVGPYLLETRNGDLESRRLVEGHVLIWTKDNITYRLESGLPLQEALHIAESLR